MARRREQRLHPQGLSRGEHPRKAAGIPVLGLLDAQNIQMQTGQELHLLAPAITAAIKDVVGTHPDGGVASDSTAQTTLQLRWQRDAASYAASRPEESMPARLESCAYHAAGDGAEGLERRDGSGPSQPCRQAQVIRCAALLASRSAVNVRSSARTLSV
jgi:hypothetical protein